VIEVIGRDLATVGQERQALDDVRQLADIAWPLLAGDAVARSSAERLRGDAIVATRALEQ
jgi:hypothetical protein